MKETPVARAPARPPAVRIAVTRAPVTMLAPASVASAATRPISAVKPPSG